MTRAKGFDSSQTTLLRVADAYEREIDARRVGVIAQVRAVAKEDGVVAALHHAGAAGAAEESLDDDGDGE